MLAWLNKVSDFDRSHVDFFKTLIKTFSKEFKASVFKVSHSNKNNLERAKLR